MLEKRVKVVRAVLQTLRVMYKHENLKAREDGAFKELEKISKYININITEGGGRGQIMTGLLNHGEEFGQYLQDNGK